VPSSGFDRGGRIRERPDAAERHSTHRARPRVTIIDAVTTASCLRRAKQGTEVELRAEEDDASLIDGAARDAMLTRIDYSSWVWR